MRLPNIYMFDHAFLPKILINVILLIFGVQFFFITPQTGSVSLNVTGAYACTVSAVIIVLNIRHIVRGKAYYFRIADVVAAVFFLVLNIISVANSASDVGGVERHANILKLYTQALCIFSIIDTGFEIVIHYLLRGLLGKKWIMRAGSGLISIAINIFLLVQASNDIYSVATIVGIGFIVGSVWEILNTIITEIRVRKLMG